MMAKRSGEEVMLCVELAEGTEELVERVAFPLELCGEMEVAFVEGLMVLVAEKERPVEEMVEIFEDVTDAVAELFAGDVEAKEDDWLVEEADLLLVAFDFTGVLLVVA